VLYGDVFEFPLTLDEIRRFCTVPLSPGAIREELETNPDLSGLVSSRNGYYFLRGRADLVGIRRERATLSAKAWRRARRVVKAIQYIPFLKGVLVTGSLAVDNARHKDDLDFLVIIGSRRLWFAFLVLGVLQRIFSRRLLCPNYYLSVDHLEIRRRSFYVAREAVQARIAYGEAICRRFQRENDWIYEIFPNAREEEPPVPPASERRGVLRMVSGAIEWMLGGRIGNALERLLAKVLKHRLAVHYGIHGQTVPEDVIENALAEVELRFHGLNHEQMIHQELEIRRERIRNEDTAR